jgi:hypothetical protein
LIMLYSLSLSCSILRSRGKCPTPEVWVSDPLQRIGWTPPDVWVASTREVLVCERAH